MTRMVQRHVSLAICLSALLAGAPASAQTASAQISGSVTGTVSDDTGGVLPGTSIDIRPEGAQNVIEAVTDGTGVYLFEDVPPGQAELTVRLINFSTVRRLITVIAGDTVTADAVLQVAQAQTS